MHSSIMAENVVSLSMSIFSPPLEKGLVIYSKPWSQGRVGAVHT